MLDVIKATKKDRGGKWKLCSLPGQEVAGEVYRRWGIAPTAILLQGRNFGAVFTAKEKTLELMFFREKTSGRGC